MGTTKISILMAILGILSLGVAVLAQAPTDTATISVNITENTYIDISPETWALTGKALGSTTTNYTFLVENIGSNNITSLYADSTYPSINPYGTGVTTNYVAGNFLLVNATGGTLNYATMVEYNDTNVWTIGYITTTGTVKSKGRFHIGSSEYFWALVNSSAGNCTDGTIYIGDTAHTYDTLGDVVLTDGDVPLLYGAETYGCADLSTPSDLNGYVLWVDDDCTKIALVKYVPSTHAFTVGATCSNDAALYSTAMQPGDVVEIDLQVKIPYSVAAGDVTSGTLTLTAV